jgi:hypothetical protein
VTGARALTRAGTLRWMLILVALWTGAGYVLGPERFSSSPSLAVVKALGPSIEVWGVVYIGIAVLCITAPRTGHIVGVVLYTWWAVCVTATLFTQDAASWAGPAYLAALATCHEIALSRVIESRHLEG